MLFEYYRREIMGLNKFSEDTFWCVKYGPEDFGILKKVHFMAWTSALAVGIGILMCITLESSTGIQGIIILYIIYYNVCT